MLTNLAIFLSTHMCVDESSIEIEKIVRNEIIYIPEEGIVPVRFLMYRHGNDAAIPW